MGAVAVIVFIISCYCYILFAGDILASGDAIHAIVGIMSVSAGVVLTDICELGYSFTQVR